MAVGTSKYRQRREYNESTDEQYKREQQRGNTTRVQKSKVNESVKGQEALVTVNESNTMRVQMSIANERVKGAIGTSKRRQEKEYKESTKRHHKADIRERQRARLQRASQFS